MRILSASLLLISHLAWAGPDVYVALGGYSSCNSAVGQPVRTGLSAGFDDAVTKRDPRPATVTTCFSGGITAGFAFNLSDSLGNVESIHLGTQFRAGLTPSMIKTIVDKVEAAIRRLDPQSVHIIGHSWGGYFGVRVAQRFEGLLGSLLTTDPISPAHCGPTDYVSNFLLPPPGCTRVPRDITLDEQRLTLRLAQGRWRNLYQSQFAYLHSGPFDALNGEGLNQRLQFSSGTPLTNYHSAMDRDSRVWAVFNQIALGN